MVGSLRFRRAFKTARVAHSLALSGLRNNARCANLCASSLSDTAGGSGSVKDRLATASAYSARTSDRRGATLVARLARLSRYGRREATGLRNAIGALGAIRNSAARLPR